MNTDATFELTPRYEVIGQVGRGLLGVVFEVRDRQTGQVRAAKVLTHAYPGDSDRFGREYQALSRRNHPHLARYHEHLELHGTQCLIGQDFDGVDLITYLRRPPTAEERESLALREARADQGLADEEDVPPSGPIEIDDQPDDLGAEEAAQQEPSAEQPDQPQPANRDDTDTNSHTVELVDEVELPEAADEPESVAEIVADLAADTAEAHQLALDLVFLRLDRVLPQLVDALEHLHRFRKEHGDLKPTNILVDRSGRCLLTDYGLLREMSFFSPSSAADEDASQPELPSLPEHPVVDWEVGAPSQDALRTAYRYRAPEALGLDDASPEADLYALGCVLFEAISGRPPFDGSPDEIRDQQLNAEPRALSELEPHCPASWADIIHGLLDKAPQRRPTLGEVRELVEYSESYAVDIPPSAVPEQEFFFGRSELVDEVLAQIKYSYQRKRLGVTVLKGPAGVGKTAISQAVSYLASRRGWLVLSGRCYKRESLIYQGWNEIAAQLADIFTELPEDLQQKADACRRQASALFADLRFEDDPDPPRLDRLDAIDSLRSLLRRLSTQRPLLLLIDDLHWASWDTSALLLDLIGEPHGLRCMVLGTWLAEELIDANHPLIDGLHAPPAPVQWFDVSGFSKDEAREYVISAGSHLSLKNQQRVLKTGEFNPLLLEELIHDLPADQDTDELARLLPEAVDADSAVADKLTEVLDRRVDALSRRERFVLELLSVASTPLPGNIVSTILDEEFHSSQSMGGSAREALSHLLEARFVRAVDSHQWAVAYTVAHNLYREHVLDQLREQHYAHLCRRIAEGMRRCWPQAEELRFEYLLRAGQVREAGDSAIRAARSAEKRFAYHRAAKLWRWLAEHASHTSMPPDIRPTVEHARAEFLAQRYDDSARLYRHAAEASAQGVDSARFRVAEVEARLHAIATAEGYEALAAGLDDLGDRLQGGILSRLAHTKDRALAATSRWTGALEGARADALDDQQWLRCELYRLVLEGRDFFDQDLVERLRTRLAVLAERSQDARTMGLDRLYLAEEASLNSPQNKQQRISRWFEDGQSLLERAEDSELRGVGEVMAANHLRRLGGFDASEQHLLEAAKYFRQASEPLARHRYLLKLTYARLLFERGQLTDAEYAARQLLHFARGGRFVPFRAYQVLAPLYLMMGRTDEVAHLLDRCEHHLAESPVNMARVWLASMHTRLNIALGRPEVAVGQLDMLREQMHGTDLQAQPRAKVSVHLSLAQALAALAQRERVLETTRRTDTLQRLTKSASVLQSRARHVAAPSGAQIYRLLARLELLRGHPKKALRRLDRGVELLVDFAAPIEHAKCLEARGYIHRSLEEADASALVEQAQAAYAHFGAHLPLFVEGWPVPADQSKLVKDGA